MRCPLCDREMQQGSLKDILFKEDVICEACRSKWERKKIDFRLDGIRVRSDYVYNDAFSECLIQYKECCDEALKDVFLYPIRKQLRKRYRGYTICLMPSSTKKLAMRGFNHLAGMYENLGMKMIEPFEKVEEKDQKGAGRMERRSMEHGIRLKPDVKLPKKLLLCDDTITTGSTLKGALRVLDRDNHRIEIYCVSANHFWITEKKKLFHFPCIQK